MIHRDEYWGMTQRAADALMQAGLGPVDVAVQCGSGMAQLASHLLEQPRTMEMASVPHFPSSAVTGHGHQVFMGTVGMARVLLLAGRVHLYEGYTPDQAGFPAAVAKALGAKAFIALNAAGGLNQLYHMGELMLHRDYLNFQGDNALAHITSSQPGERFLDMRDAYSPKFGRVLKQGLASAGASVQEGVYAAMRGPVFETPAELDWLRSTGADAVGMSTVPEIMICRAFGLRAAAISVITNECFHQDGPQHGAILTVAEDAIPILGRGLCKVLEDGGWE